MELPFADDLVAVTTTRESMDRAASILQDLLGSFVECCEDQVAGCRKQGRDRLEAAEVGRRW